MKGIRDGLPRERFMFDEVPPFVDRAPSPREVHLRTLLGAIESPKAGVTAARHDAFFTPVPDLAAIDALTSAYAESGLRVTIALDQPNVVDCRQCPCLEDPPASALGAWMTAASLPTTADLVALDAHPLETRHDAGDGRLRAPVSGSAPHRVTKDHLARLAATERERGRPFDVHMLKARLQRVCARELAGGSLVRLTADRDPLDARTNLVHGLWIDADDVAAIAAAGALVVHNAVCNLRGGGGIMPFRRLGEPGISIVLGTNQALADDASNLWTSVDLTGLVHKVSDLDVQPSSSARKVLDHVFAGGARATGLADRLGPHRRPRGSRLHRRRSRDPRRGARHAARARAGDRRCARPCHPARTASPRDISPAPARSTTAYRAGPPATAGEGAPP